MGWLARRAERRKHNDRDFFWAALRRRLMGGKMPWRAGWRGRLLRIHSPSAHPLGRCWCQRAEHNDRDFSCRYWRGDRSGSLVGLDKETCTICREER